MAQVNDHLTDDGRVLLNFGTSGDIAYLHELIEKARLRKRVFTARVHFDSWIHASGTLWLHGGWRRRLCWQ